MNEAECGASWSERLASEAVAQAVAGRVPRGETEMRKLHSCAAGLASAAAAFRAARDLAAAALAADLAAPARAWAVSLVSPYRREGRSRRVASRLAARSVHCTVPSRRLPDEMIDDADALPHALDAFVEAASLHLSSKTTEALVTNVVIDIASKADEFILQNNYTRVSSTRRES